MNESEERQRARDKEYLDAWQHLTPAQRRELQKAGISGPQLPSYCTHRPEMPDAENLPVEAPADDNGCPDIADTAQAPLRAAGECLKAFLFRIIDGSNNPRLEAECISLAFGYGAAKGISQTAVAKRYGLTRAAISKRVRDIKEAFDLPASEFMKSDRARAVYQLTNKPRA